MSGLIINFHKSMAMWLGGNVEQHIIIASLFNYKVGSFSVTYLGIPLRPGNLLKEDW